MGGRVGAEKSTDARPLRVTITPDLPTLDNAYKWGQEERGCLVKRGGRGTRGKARETLSKREKVNELLALYQNRELPILRGKLTAPAY